MTRHAIAIRIFLSCAALWVASTAAHAASIRGQLLHQNGQPAASVTVTISDHKNYRSAPAHAGSDGMYYIYNIPAGQYYLEVWVNPNTPQTYQVTVAEPSTDMPRVTVP
jgi:hypothetical protein